MATDFPTCADGDVAVLLSPMKTYKLHSQVLSRFSTFFAEQLDRDPAFISAKARREGAASYHFELTMTFTGDSFGRLEQRELSENGKPKHSNFERTDLDGLLADEDSVRQWDLLFRAFYAIQIKFNDENMAVLLQDCSGLLDVAESIGSVERIRDIVDLSLMRQDKVLWRSIYANPAAWAGLGARIQSPSIFREAVVHLVGNWKHIDVYAKDNLDPDVRAIVEKKHDYSEQFKRVVELRIAGHYPRCTWRKPENNPGREEYAKEIYPWMASSFFRHWLMQQYFEGHSRHGPDGGYQFYHNLWKSGDAYLRHEDFMTYHEYFPMSRKACTILENAMMDIKDEVRGFVKDLVVNRTHIPAKELSYITCTQLEKGDFPWEIKDEAMQTPPAEYIERTPESDIESVVVPGSSKPKGSAPGVAGVAGRPSSPEVKIEGKPRRKRKPKTKAPNNANESTAAESSTGQPDLPAIEAATLPVKPKRKYTRKPKVTIDITEAGSGPSTAQTTEPPKKKRKTTKKAAKEDTDGAAASAERKRAQTEAPRTKRAKTAAPLGTIQRPNSKEKTTGPGGADGGSGSVGSGNVNAAVATTTPPGSPSMHARSFLGGPVAEKDAEKAAADVARKALELQMGLE
ncbi:uncharacterized protein AB675_8989 [Cyphellophora attinorum]|uniref:BTB domain-containing protein n=1 Tax=Cyphellophora attinorum TaxID=1664694 RepID=A0A0N0NNB3_9EURO|nr:uncharacterized protein AB675_8989 [Phialophora attinorum]KPI41421.1 hypothetical protein AB675_8989 [Phialophora attinorum]